MQVLRVADAMVTIPAPAPFDRPINELIARFAAEGLDAVPVVDAGGMFRGTITAALEGAAQENVLDAPAGQLARITPTVRADQTLEAALGVLVTDEWTGLPVVSADGQHLAGWITHRDVLRAYKERLHRGVNPADTDGN